MTRSARRPPSLVRDLIGQLGGRYSTEAGIDVDGGPHEVERWFLAATLFGTRISAAIAMRTYRTLSAAGVATIGDAGRQSWDDLVVLLDAGGYTRYDYRTATRLHDLAAAVAEKLPDGIATFGRGAENVDALAVALDELPGWGPVTVGAFLRELRGVWPAADPPIDRRAVGAARHLGLAGHDEPVDAVRLERLAIEAEADPRDLEAALVRFALAHERGYERCRPTPDAACRFLVRTAGAARS